MCIDVKNIREPFLIQGWLSLFNMLYKMKRYPGELIDIFDTMLPPMGE
jgi:hypothetical protein